MAQHTWRFFTAGGVEQVQLETADDLRNLASLDQTLWVALAAPVHGTTLDERTMALVDTDRDGRIRAPEVIAAVALVCALLKDPSVINRSPQGLRAVDIREDSPEGRVLRASAAAVLVSRGKAPTDELCITDIADPVGVFANMTFNGDGVIHAGMASDPALATLIGEITNTLGAEKDRGGRDGVSIARIDSFFEAAKESVAWLSRATLEAATLLPLGPEGTPAALSAVEALRPKVEDFFARERLARFDPRAQSTLQPPESAYVALSGGQISAGTTEALPIALIVPGRGLPLEEGINPAWSARIAALRALVVEPLIGDRRELSEQDWATLLARLAPFQSWQSAKPTSPVAALGTEKLTGMLGSGAQARLTELCRNDEGRRAEAEALDELERLVRYTCHLGQLLRNFVSFADFYGRKTKAAFQAGTVWFDQRRCDLVTQVADPGRHAILAGQSGSYLAYLDCSRRSDGRKLMVCVAVTDGESDNLMVGRNGLFYDRAGLDYDATIIKIVDNPISVRQAFWSPYKKFLRMVEELISKRAAEADTKSQSTIAAGAQATATADQTQSAAPTAPPAAKPFDVGIIAALGVAVGGITAALGALLQAFFGLGFWMPLGLLGLVFCISGPSMLIAALKLRRRNLGPILDADGWAVNAQARINIPFGRSLTHLAELPEGATNDLEDPFAPPGSPWKSILVVLLVLCVGLLAWLHHDGIIVLPGLGPTLTATEPAAPPAPTP